jgi:hypothetical protein
LSNLFLELLDGDFGLENPAHASAPVLFQALHLPLYLVLAGCSRGIEEVDVAFRVGEIAL